MPTTARSTVAPTKRENNSVIAGEFVRRRALDRLYERRAIVEELIRSLECYQRMNRRQPGKCVPFIAQRKCS
jgi:hypothetical protein